MNLNDEMSNLQEELEKHQEDNYQNQNKPHSCCLATTKATVQVLDEKKNIEKPPHRSNQKARSIIRAWIKSKSGKKWFEKFCNDRNLGIIQSDNFSLTLLINLCNDPQTQLNIEGNILIFLYNHQYIQEFEKIGKIPQEEYGEYIKFVNYYLPLKRKKMQT